MISQRHRTTATVIAIALLCAPAAMSSPADYVKWTDTRQVGPFQIQSTFPLAKYDKLFAELPDLQREITRTLGVPPATSNVNVFLFSSEEQYRAYINRHFPQVPYRPALFVVEAGSPGVYTFEKSDLDIDLRHECTHALLHASMTAVPLWLDEGIAKYFEVPAAQRAFDHPYFDDLKWMHGPEPAHQALVRYLACYQQSTPPDKLSVLLAEAVPNPTDRMIQHFKHWQH
jgi:hypothetical protein